MSFLSGCSSCIPPQLPEGISLMTDGITVFWPFGTRYLGHLNPFKNIPSSFDAQSLQEVFLRRVTLCAVCSRSIYAIHASSLTVPFPTLTVSSGASPAWPFRSLCRLFFFLGFQWPVFVSWQLLYLETDAQQRTFLPLADLPTPVLDSPLGCHPASCQPQKDWLRQTSFSSLFSEQSFIQTSFLEERKSIFQCPFYYEVTA